MPSYSHTFPPPKIPPDLDQTAPPRRTPDGQVECSGCDAVVAYEQIAITEDGYFCPGCARTR